MKLYAVRIFVDDWDKACDFYENKLSLPVRYKNDGIGWAEFDVGGPGLGIERVDPDDAEATALVGRFLGLSLQVDDIDSTYQQLKAAGVEFSGPPEPQPWGGMRAHFKDPAGNTLTLLG